MEDRDTDEFILVLKGYFKLLMAMNLPIDREGDSLHMDSGKPNIVLSVIYVYDLYAFNVATHN